MPEWLIWVLIVAVVIVAFVGFGAGQITTSTQRRNRQYADRYDPVYLQQQEAQEAARHADAP